MEKLKFTGTKWYVDVEYKGNIARFGGEMCTNGFSASMDSGKWIKHKGNDCNADMNELFRAVDNHNKDIKNTFKLYFYDNVGNRII